MDRTLHGKTSISLCIIFDDDAGQQRRIVSATVGWRDTLSLARMMADELKRSNRSRVAACARSGTGRIANAVAPPNDYETAVASMAQALIEAVRATMNDDSAGAEGPLQDEASASRADARPSDSRPSPEADKVSGDGDATSPVADQTTLGQMEHAVESASRLIMLPSADFGATPEDYRHSLSRLLALIAIWMKGGANVDRDRN